MQMNEMALQVIEAAKGHKACCIDAGFSEESAEHMAIVYYAALIEAAFHAR